MDHHHHVLSPDLVFPEEEMFWYEVIGEESNVPVLNQSAFTPYTKRTEQGSPEKPYSGGGTAAAEKNMKRRMVNLLRRNWEEKKKAAAPARERGQRHMINERMRRDKQRQSYFALHSLLPHGTKNDKNSIVQGALNRIEDLQRRKRELERRIHSLETAAMAMENTEGEDIVLKVRDPVSGIDSMLEALRCLKNLGTKPNTAQANFSSQEFSTIMNIETQIAAEAVEKILEKTLQEAEWKLLFAPEVNFHLR